MAAPTQTIRLLASTHSSHLISSDGKTSPISPVPDLSHYPGDPTVPAGAVQDRAPTQGGCGELLPHCAFQFAKEQLKQGAVPLPGDSVPPG